MLFQVLTEREETASVAISSNESFSGWAKTFTDPRLYATIVGRLTFARNIIESGTESGRLAHACAVRPPPVPPILEKDRMHNALLPTDAPDPTDPDVQFSAASEQITTALLKLCEEFLRHASPIVHTELSQFLTENDYRPGNLGWFLDTLGFTTLLNRIAADRSAGAVSR
jgi:hypothetical protein